MWYEHLWYQCRHHLFKGSAFVVTSTIFVLVFITWPRLINQGLDLNLATLKWIAKMVELKAPSWGDTFEAFTRFWNFERFMLFGEAVAVVKLVMLALGKTFRSGYHAFRPRK